MGGFHVRRTCVFEPCQFLVDDFKIRFLGWGELFSGGFFRGNGGCDYPFRSSSWGACVYSDKSNGYKRRYFFLMLFKTPPWRLFCFRTSATMKESPVGTTLYLLFVNHKGYKYSLSVDLEPPCCNL